MYIVFYRNYLRCCRLHQMDKEKYVVITDRRIATFVSEEEIVDKIENMMDDAQLKEHYPEYYL
jgi:hypothetical protein